MADLTAIGRLLDDRYFEHARDWCALLMAFFGLLRISEYMDAGLRVRHVRLTAAGLDVTVYKSKTAAAPHTISVSARSDSLCPERAFRRYADFLSRLGLSSKPDDALFLHRFDNQAVVPMTSAQFIERLRSYIRSAFPNRDVSLYAGHSLRRGGATTLILAGVPAAVIKAHGRWASDTYERYYDDAHSQEVRLAATRALTGARQ